MNYAIPLHDLRSLHESIAAELKQAAERVLASGRFILGPEVAAFEQELGGFLGADNVVGVSSGTDALTASLLAAELPAGTRVLTTPFSFFATVSAIVRAGCTPVFCDLAKDGFSIDADTVRANLGTDSGAVLVVHLYGMPGPVAPLRALCDSAGCLLIEDAAQALGAAVGGRQVGTFGDYGAFSFFPSKSLGALGDGGAVRAGTPDAAQRLRRIRQHGSSDRKLHESLGGNYRLDALQAAFLRVKLPLLEARLARTVHLAKVYEELLADVAEISLPMARAGERPSYSLYTLRVPTRRAALRESLHAAGIETRVHYEVPLHLQPALRHLGYARGDFPEAERLAEEVVSIPLHADMTEPMQLEVANAIRGAFGYARR